MCYNISFREIEWCNTSPDLAEYFITTEQLIKWCFLVQFTYLLSITVRHFGRWPQSQYVAEAAME